MHFVSYMFDLKVNITYVCVLNIHMNLVCSGQGHNSTALNHHDNTEMEIYVSNSDEFGKPISVMIT